MINSFQRVMTVIEGKKPDRIPVIPQITYTTAQLTGVGLVEALHNPKKTALALLAGQKELGYDAIYAGWESSFNLLAEAMGCIMRFPENSVPQVAEHCIKTANDIEKLNIPDPSKTGRLPLHIELLRLIRADVKNRVPIFVYTPGPFTLAGQLCGITTLMASTLRDPIFVQDLLKITTEASIQYALANIESGADVIVTADPTSSGSLISSKTFEAFTFPSLTRVAAAVNKAGAISSLHICGKTGALLEMMAKTGAKILELDHMVDLAEAKQRVGNQVILMGNLNPTELLLSGTPEQIEREVKMCIEAAGRDGRYIVSSGCEIPPLAPLENIRAMVTGTQKYGCFT